MTNYTPTGLLSKMWRKTCMMDRSDTGSNSLRCFLCSYFWLLPLQILQKLLERLTGEQLQVSEVTQSEEGQRSKLRVVLGFANHILGLQRGQAKWSVESVHTKNIVSILHLLVSRVLIFTCAFIQHCTTHRYPLET